MASDSTLFSRRLGSATPDNLDPTFTQRAEFVVVLVLDGVDAQQLFLTEAIRPGVRTQVLHEMLELVRHVDIRIHLLPGELPEPFCILHGHVIGDQIDVFFVDTGHGHPGVNLLLNRPQPWAGVSIDLCIKHDWVRLHHHAVAVCHRVVVLDGVLRQHI